MGRHNKKAEFQVGACFLIIHAMNCQSIIHIRLPPTHDRIVLKRAKVQNFVEIITVALYVNALDELMSTWLQNNA